MDVTCEIAVALARLAMTLRLVLLNTLGGKEI